MKGLLMKDIYLMTSQRRFFLFILAFAVVIMFLTGSATFAIGYTTFLGGLFALTTVNYDELENGFTFLFTLPISRKEYALEKYIFGIAVGAGCCLFSTLLGLVANGLLDLGEASEIITTALFTYSLLLFFLALVIPLHFRFSSEKACMVLLVLIAAGIGFSFSLGTMGVLDGKTLATFSTGIGMIVLVSFLALCLTLSYFLSVHILNKKDF